MKQLSIMDKIKVVIDMTKSNKMFFVILILLLFLSILFATTSRKNAKESKITYGLIYLAREYMFHGEYKKAIDKFNYIINNFKENIENLDYVSCFYFPFSSTIL